MWGDPPSERPSQKLFAKVNPGPDNLLITLLILCGSLNTITQETTQRRPSLTATGTRLAAKSEIRIFTQNLLLCKDLHFLKTQTQNKKGPPRKRVLLCAGRAESGHPRGPGVSAALPAAPSGRGTNARSEGGTPHSGKSLSLDTDVPCALGTNEAN